MSRWNVFCLTLSKIRTKVCLTVKNCDDYLIISNANSLVLDLHSPKRAKLYRVTILGAIWAVVKCVHIGYRIMKGIYWRGCHWFLIGQKNFSELVCLTPKPNKVGIYANYEGFVWKRLGIEKADFDVKNK